MNEERREIVLWLAAAALLLGVGMAAIGTAPDLQPLERIPYSAPSEKETAPLSSASFRLNLNQADKASLMRLNGLGEKTAEHILAYRESHGGFSSVEELLNVEGIGEKRLAAWRPFLTV